MEIFRKQALLGCPKDYEIFERNLQVIIEKAHDGNLTHKGKIPSGISTSTKSVESQTAGSSDTTKDKKEIKTGNEMKELEKQLEQAVRNEDYELAAKLRDQLKAMQ
jgi:protein arginine kinase activator